MENRRNRHKKQLKQNSKRVNRENKTINKVMGNTNIQKKAKQNKTKTENKQQILLNTQKQERKIPLKQKYNN